MYNVQINTLTHISYCLLSFVYIFFFQHLPNAFGTAQSIYLDTPKSVRSKVCLPPQLTESAFTFRSARDCTIFGGLLLAKRGPVPRHPHLVDPMV